MSIWSDVVAPLLLASVLGAVVGLERELHGRPAGLRTHILLSLGAALFGMLSHGIHSPQSDPTRIAAQVVTGIGFIGAGTIIHLGGTVRGLTTAASIWATAAIGLAVGLGRQFWTMAVTATLLAFLTLAFVHLLEDRLRLKRRLRDIEVTARAGHPTIDAILDILSSMRVEVLVVRRLPSLQAETSRYEVSIDLPARVSEADVMAALSERDEILEVKLG